MPAKWIVYFLWVITLLLLPSGCRALTTDQPDQTRLPSPTAKPARTPTPHPTPTEVVIQGTVSIWHAWQDPQLPALLRQIASFQEIYPNIHFDVQYVPRIDLRASFEQASIDGYPPTLLIAPGEWGPELYRAGMVADLSGSLPAATLERLNPAAVQIGQSAGAQIGAPLAIEGVVLYRNRALITEAPLTFDDLVRDARSASRGETVGAYLERSFFYAGGHLYGLGGAFFDANGEPAFNNPQGVAWLDLLARFEQAGPTTLLSDDDLTLFKNGQAGMIVEGTWVRDDLATAIGAANLAIDRWPIYADGALSGFVRSENLYLTPRASLEEHQVTLKFLSYLLETGAQTGLAEVGLIPALDVSVEELAGRQVTISDPLVAQAMLALAGGAAYPVSPETSIYTSQLDLLLRAVFVDGAEPAQALPQAQEAINAQIQARQATPTPAP